MKLVWTVSAQTRLLALTREIARDKPRAATDFAAMIYTKSERIGIFPKSGRVVPEYSHPSLREIIAGNYRIVYQIGKKEILILSVWEGHNPLPDDPSSL